MMLTNPTYLKQVLGQFPKRTLSQNFLIEPLVIQKTLEYVHQGPPSVLELGSGPGALTLELLKAGFAVKALEKDESMARILQDHVPPEHRPLLELIVGDMRDSGWEKTPPYQIVGNIPYHLSGLIIRRLTQLNPAPTQCILLVQQEVGQRLRAKPPDMHLSSVALQLWGTCSKIVSVKPGSFWPAPRVTSELILLKPQEKPLVTPPKREDIIGFSKIFFQKRRKQMGTSFRTHIPDLKESIPSLFSHCLIDPKQRPQELSIENWVCLYDTVMHHAS